jgi:hypothetical protein
LIWLWNDENVEADIAAWAVAARSSKDVVSMSGLRTV